jgi:hypothetical protein
MGSARACTGLRNVPLWYAHYDGRDTFADFTPFGGWTKPNMKQYIGDTTMCGAGVDLSFWLFPLTVVPTNVIVSREILMFHSISSSSISLNKNDAVTPLHL